MVPIKNVTVTATPVVQIAITGTNQLDNTSLGTPVVGIQCYLNALTPDQVWMMYDVKLENPALLQTEVTDAASFHVQAQVLVTASTGSGGYNGMVFSVHGRVAMHDDGYACDHAAFLLDQKTYPLVNP